MSQASSPSDRQTPREPRPGQDVDDAIHDRLLSLMDDDGMTPIPDDEIEIEDYVPSDERPRRSDGTFAPASSEDPERDVEVDDVIDEDEARAKEAADAKEAEAEEPKEEEAKEGEEEEGVYTFGDLAKQFEVEEDVLAEHLHIELDGEDPVTLKEVLDSYREAPAAIQARRDFEHQKDQFQGKLNDLHQREDEGFRRLAGLTDRMLRMVEGERRSEADWQRLRQEDPVQYGIERDKQREYEQTISESLQMLREADTRRTREEQERWDEFVRTETQKVFDARPSWWNRRTGEATEEGVAAAKAIDKVLLEVGYTQEEVDKSCVDHRLILLADLAAQSKKEKVKLDLAKKKVKGVPRVLPKKGATDEGGDTTKQGQRKALRRRLRQTGDERVAARLLEDLL